MNLGNRLLSLRKKKGLSQEEAADALGVSRQTISKWETDQSTPDFDKIIPLCKLYEISTDELITGTETMIEPSSKTEEPNDYEQKRKEKAKYIGLGVFLYFVAIATFMMTPLHGDPMISLPLFLIICGLATYSIVYGNIVYRRKVKQKEEKTSLILRTIISILAILTTVAYFVISFTTYAWHITWLIWIIFAAVAKIVKLIYLLKEDSNEE